MLVLQRAVLEQVRDAFLRSPNLEQGFLLGSRRNLEEIDVCQPVPVRQAGTYFIVPDAEQADRAITSWATRGICFCGMIHSHVRKKQDLSEGDLAFAKQLSSAYPLPFLWFGIGITAPPNVRFKFYKLAQNGAAFSISPASYTNVSYRRK